MLASTMLNATVISVQRIPGGVSFSTDSQTKTYVFYTDRIVKIHTQPSNVKAKDKAELVVTAEPESVTVNYSENNQRIRVSTSELILEINKQTGKTLFLSARTGKKYLEDTGMTQSADSEFCIAQNFKITPTESLYGLGQFQDGVMDYKGKELLLSQSNQIAIVPFMLSSNQYGLLWNLYSKCLFSEKQNNMTFQTSYKEAIDYYFIAGETPDKVISGYRHLTGKAPMFPKTAFGFWQSKERYTSFEELHQVVDKYRKRDLPIDNIVQDWQYWGDNSMWSSMYFEPFYFPNPANNIEKLHDKNVRLMCSIWPAQGSRTHIYGELKEKDLLFEPTHWCSGKLIDFYNPEGKQIYYKHLKRGLLENGIDAIWFDGTEPEVNNTSNQSYTEKGILSLGEKCYYGDIKQYFNTYSLEASKGVYENYRKDYNDRIFILTRSAFTGQQRNATVTWSGDIVASWDIFRKQISAGLNFCMAGIPYWTHDIGGFFPNGPIGEFIDGIKNPAYRELYARWFQFGAFTPIFRSHGTGTPRDAYLFEEDELVYSSLKNTLNLRYQLMPYIYSHAWKVYNEDYTLMRGLVMDFKDKKTKNIDDTYMFGSSLLVQPITKAMYRPTAIIGQIIVTDYLRNLNNEKGLSVEYFNDRVLKDKVYETTHANIDHDWAGIAPENLPQNNFSMTWQGKLLPPKSGEFELGAIVDDGIRVYINDELVIDSWIYRSTRYVSSRYTFEEGKEYKIRVDYFDAGGEAGIKLTWRTPDELLAESGKPTTDLIQTTYLPTDTDWYDFWTGKKYKGGQKVTREYSLDVFPLFVKAGSILPIGPRIQYATEETGQPMEIRIYKGKNASFTLYEDDNETYDYEKGEYATIDFNWNDKTRTLSISDQKGSFKGIQPNKTFHITVVDTTNGIGVGSSQPTKTVEYTGKPVVVKL